MAFIDPEMQALVDALERQVEAAEKAMARKLAEAVYGQDAESRVDDLRKSIMGDDAPPRERANPLAAWLPPSNPESD